MAPRGPVHGPTMSSGAATATALAPETALARYVSFQSLVDLVGEHRDMKLKIDIESYIRLVSYRPGFIEFEMTPDADADFPQRLRSRLHAFTGQNWGVTLAKAPEGTQTLREVAEAEERALRAKAMEHPMVAKVFELFPGAEITKIRTPEAIAQEAALDALQEVEDEWDPFEE